MATKTIGYDNSGVAGDYTTLAAWLTYLQGLGTLAAPEVGELMWGTSTPGTAFVPTATFSLTGFTPTATNTLTLQPKPGYGFKDASGAATNQLYPGAGNVAMVLNATAYIRTLDIQVPYVTVRGLQIACTDASSKAVVEGAAHITIDSCLIAAATGGTTYSVVLFDATCPLTNTVVVLTGSAGYGVEVNGASLISDCTVVRPAAHSAAGTGIDVTSAATLKGCAVFGFTSPTTGTFNSASDYNATDQSALGTSFPGTHNLVSQTYSNCFVNTGSTLSASDFRLKSGSPLIDAGVTISGVGADVIGTTRPQGSAADIGAWEFASAGSATTLTAASGAFALTGNAAALGRGLKLTAAAGAFTETGSAATLKRGLKLTAAAGAFTETGSAAGLSVGHRLTASAGSFSESGNAAALGRGLKLTAAAGAFALTGVPAGLSAGHRLTAASGAFALSGNAATLTHTAAGSFNLTASAGAFAVTGSAATPRKALKLTAAAGSFTLTGDAAALSRGLRLSAAPGGFTASGVAVALLAARRLTSAAGSFTLTGDAATLVYTPAGARSLALSAAPGGFTLTGSAATLTANRATAPRTAFRDADVLEQIAAALEATSEFDFVLRALPEEAGLPTGTTAAAVVQPLSWDQADTSHAMGFASTNPFEPDALLTRHCKWTLTLIARDPDPGTRDRLADRLYCVAADALDGKSAGGLTVPQWTRLLTGKYSKPEPPERRLVCTGEFSYLVAGYAGHPTGA